MTGPALRSTADKEEIPMRKFVRGAAITALSIMTGAGLGLVMTSAQAQYDIPQSKAKVQAKATLRKEVIDSINSAIKGINAMDYAAAGAALERGEAIKDKTPAEDFQIAKIQAVISMQQPMPDIAKASM